MAALVFAGALPLLGLAGGLVSLTLTLALLGAASGALDVAMNTAAVELEAVDGRALMPGLHGAYSAGVLGGAIGGGTAAAAAMPILQHFLVVGAMLLVLLGAVWPALPTAVPRACGSPDRAGPSNAHIPALLFLVLLAVSALLLEGVLTDWTAVLASGPPFSDATVAALIVAAFSSAMTLSRAFSARVLRAVGPRTVVVTSSSTLLVTVAVSALQSSPAGLLAGTVLAGLAIGPLFPMVMSAAGARDPDNAGSVTAKVTACGYLAYLGGPPAVGFLSGRLGLPVALALVGVSASLVLLALGRIGLTTPDRRPRHRDAPALRVEYLPTRFAPPLAGEARYPLRALCSFFS
ncbi:MFS transporter [Pseudonocardia parietis]|uniref:MFS transporter n=1 Tax=Pseudonocardia parietis TaxID=570936 RepID=UPI001AE5AF85|nr:MFS transporter [Pseudonocardia parietis]